MLVPVPRANLVRYHGVLAPRSRLRAAIAPGYADEPDSETETPGGDSPDTEPKRKPRRYAWADLMRRVFELDVLECARSGE